MRVLFLASWFPTRVHPTHGNFVEKHARTVASAHELFVLNIQADPQLARRQFKVENWQKEDYAGLTVYFGQNEATPSWQRIWLRAKAWRMGLENYRKQFGQPTIVHAHVLLDAGIVAGFYHLFTGVPFVVTEHSTAYWSSDALPGLRGVLGRWAVRRAAFMLPVTTALGKTMQDQHGLHGRYRTVGNVVNTEVFHYTKPPKQPPFTFLHISNFRDWHKNVSGLLRAFKSATELSAHPLKLRLAGDGNLTDWQSSIAELKLKPEAIELSGPHSETEIATLIRSAHAFVLFSNVENQPVVILEALSSGRPCIATPVGGLPELISPENGILVPVSDESAMTTALLEIVNKYKGFDGPGIRKRTVEICGESAIRDAFSEVYALALQSRTNG
ncbi:hypothetical protein CEQ90_04455 [Lewinellaceae bacterium SD302]|nr:hypothetical protein CEQ90_04455 [Lewinellaceae bacterium SD302]